MSKKTIKHRIKGIKTTHKFLNVHYFPPYQSGWERYSQSDKQLRSPSTSKFEKVNMMKENGKIYLGKNTKNLHWIGNGNKQHQTSAKSTFKNHWKKNKLKNPTSQKSALLQIVKRKTPFGQRNGPGNKVLRFIQTRRRGIEVHHHGNGWIEANHAKKKHS